MLCALSVVINRKYPVFRNSVPDFKVMRVVLGQYSSLPILKTPISDNKTAQHLNKYRS